MIDEDLAELYGVSTKRLNQQVTRNKTRFPEDFMLRLTKEEAAFLRSQFAISNDSLRLQFATSKIPRGGRRHLPYVFTEQGVAMLSSVLNSEQAIEVNIAIMRAFVRLRQMLETNDELNRQFAAVIRKLSTHDKYFRVVFDFGPACLRSQFVTSRSDLRSKYASSRYDVTFDLIAARFVQNPHFLVQ